VTPLPPSGKGAGADLAAGGDRHAENLQGLLDWRNSGILVAEYVTELPTGKIFEQKIHSTVVSISRQMR
jgi:hypothetical protein